MTTTAFHSLRGILARLLTTPTYALLTVGMLTLGLGTSLFMFSGVNSWILKPLPFPEGDALVALWRDHPARGVERMSVLPHDYLDWRDRQTGFVDLAAVSTGTINLSDDQRPERYSGAFISANAFDTFKVQPAMGRMFTEAEAQPGGPGVVMISHRVWQQRYAGDPAVIGRQIRVNSRPATIIGIMPAGFRFPMDEDVWVPLRLDPASLARDEGIGLDVFGRLQPQVSLVQAQHEMDQIAAVIARAHPQSHTGIGAVVAPYAHSYVDRQARELIWTLFAAVLTVLAIACANVANLTLTRITTRRRELAIKSALGASRSRLVAGVLAELAVLALIALALGLGLAEVLGNRMDAWWDMQGLATPYWIQHSIDWRYMLFGGGAAALSVLLAGLWPALRATGSDFFANLKDGGHGTAGSALGRFRRGLMIFQVALSCVLLVSAGLMIRSLGHLSDHDNGLAVEPGQVLTARLGLFEDTYPTAEHRRRFYLDLVERLENLPGARSASLATSLPGTGASGNRHASQDNFSETAVDLPAGRHVLVGDGYFDTLGIARRAGRVFDHQDRHDTQPVVVIDHLMAEYHWPNESAIGRRLWLSVDGGHWFEVVGVVEQVLQDPPDTPPRPTAYLPLKQHDARFVSVVLHSSGETPEKLAGPLREAVLSLDPELPLHWVRSLAEALEETRFLRRLLVVLFGLFGLVAVLLVAVGMFAVLAYTLSLRLSEVGLRRALGASDSGIMRMVLGESLGQLAAGLAFGLVLAAGFAHLLSAWLLHVRPLDPATFGGVAALLLVVTLAASAAPLKRAFAVEPVTALRHE